MSPAMKKLLDENVRLITAKYVNLRERIIANETATAGFYAANSTWREAVGPLVQAAELAKAYLLEWRPTDAQMILDKALREFKRKVGEV